MLSDPNTAPYPCRVSFGDYAGAWLDAHGAQLKDSSRNKYRNIIDKHLLPRFGTKNPAEIRRDDLLRLTRALLNDGFKQRSITAILSLARSILLYARQCGEAIEDPGTIPLKQDARPPRVFTRSEQERLTAYLARQDDLGCRGILLSLFTGLRIGELCALKWGDISFDDRCIQVRRTMQRLQTFADGRKTVVCIASPKSFSSERSIPLPDELLRELGKIRQPDDCYFLSGSAERFIEPRTMEYRFKAVIRACGISNASFHTCRHSFATRCVELGFDVKTLSEILGHANVNITMNRYVHPSMEFKRENMKRLSALFPRDI